MSTTPAAPHVVRRDNGYFEIWALPCGHEVRVSTEATQFARTRGGRRAQLQASTKQWLATATCNECATPAPTAAERAAERDWFEGEDADD